MRKIQFGWWLIRHLGLWWVVFRLKYAVRRRAGFLERATPLEVWKQVGPLNFPRLFTAPVSIGIGCLEEADEIGIGKFRLFSLHRVDAGFPPNWHRNQMTEEVAKAAVHWSRMGDFAYGDIKAIWELSRFSWAFTLARAYAKTGDEKYAGMFWRLFEDWLTHNPPNQGPNWMCGQEASFRLMAVTFAVDVLGAAEASTVDRKIAFGAFVIATGRRIAPNLDYALSQSNNHGISEAVGLITAGLLAKDYQDAKKWRHLGLIALQKQLATLVYPDGAFSQHSATYHRVLLHDLLWLHVVMRAFGEPMPHSILEVSLRAGQFLESLMTFETGSVPLYGASDGANILPLVDAEYGDFRPLVQACSVVFKRRRLLPPGSWDELADWLVGPAAAAAKLDDRTVGGTQANVRATLYNSDGGCLVWRNGATRLFFRCPTKFRHRPGHADLLHVDIEWKRIPIAIDAGTFSYNAPQHVAGDFSEAALHNTVTFGGREPMEKISRFLYLPWPNGRCGWDGVCRFEAEHDGWARFGCKHMRAIETFQDDGFLITDNFIVTSKTTARVHWLLADLPYRLNSEESHIVLCTPSGEVLIEWAYQGARVEVIRGAANGNRGWCAPRYYERRPALSLSLSFDCVGILRGWTRFTPKVNAE